MNPNFFIVGAAKSGTTSLANYLAEHPKIATPKLKEPRFFVKDALVNINDRDPMKEYILKNSVLKKEEYLKMFKSPKEDTRLKFDASVHYLYHCGEAIPKIKTQIGDVPIIILLRNPSERAISSANYSKNWHDNNLEHELSQEELRIKEGYNSFWFHKNQGLYSSQIKAYLDNFSNVKIILFDDLIKNPKLIVNEVFQFLSLEQLEMEKYPTHNTSFEANKALKIIRKTKVLSTLKKLIGSKNWKKVRTSSKSLFFKNSSKEITKKLEDKLYQFYEKDVEKIESLIGKKLPEWKKK
jgi:hypothetical protein